MDEILKQILPFLPWIITAVIIVLFLLRGKIKDLSISKETGIKIDFKDDEKKVVNVGEKIFVSPEHIADKLDLFIERYNDINDEIHSLKNLSFEQQMKFSEDKWNSFIYHLVDYYTTNYLTKEEYSKAEYKIKYLETSLKLYWFIKLKEQFSNSFKRNGFHAFRKVVENNVIDNKEWQSFLDRITSSLFHDFRHFLLGRYSFSTDVPVNELLTAVGFQSKNEDGSFSPDKLIIDFVKQVYENSWTIQEGEKQTIEDFRVKKAELKTASLAI